MTITNEGQYVGEHIRGEANGPVELVRKEVTIISGQNLPAGAILGEIAVGAATADPDEGNTGDGAMGAITVGPNAIAGDYVLTITSEASNAGGFNLVDPQGDIVGQGTVGVAFASTHLSFTLADGAEDFDTGDSIVITVAAGSGKFTAYDADATNGAQVACAVLYDAVDATDGDEQAVVNYANTVVHEDLVDWNDQDAGAIAAGKKQLAARGIIVASGY